MSEQTPPTQGAQQPVQGQQVQIHLREDKANTVYSNFCRVMPGPNAEEIAVDFAISQQSPDRPEVILMDVNTKVLMSVYAAKRLALTLSQTLQRYEQQFGVVELDPRRRLKQG